MRVLDASALIAHLDRGDAHHDAIERVLVAGADEDLAASAVTVAETLVGAVRAGTLDVAVRSLDDLGLSGVPVSDSRAAVIELATLRAQTGLPLPDCCVLQAAASVGATAIVTVDRRLARAARERGLNVP